MFSRILSAPFLILAIGFLYLTWEVSNSYSLYIIPCVVILAIIYIMSPQIDWWWAKRNPPDLDDKVRAMIHQRLPFYNNLSPEGKTFFRQRVALYLQTKDFKPQVFDRVPEDIKAIIACGAIMVTFNTEDFLLEPFDTLIVYPDAFPSPQYPMDRHSSEVFEEDGVVLFSARHVAHGFLDAQKYYPTFLHEFIQVYRLKYPELKFPSLPAEPWGDLETISGFSREKVEEWIGLPEIDVQLVAAAFFFTRPEQMRTVWPGVFQEFERIFKLDPSQAINTVPLVS
jgi:hypothetical protein